MPAKTKQTHTQPNAQEIALADWKEKAADHAKKAQRWKDAQERRIVRGDDLVKVHQHVPLDEDAVARVAAECADAIRMEHELLQAKQAAKKAVDEAWVTVRNFDDSDPVKPLFPNDEPDE